MTTPVPATLAEFDAFLTEFVYDVPATERPQLLALSYVFFCSLPWCDDVVLDDAKVLQAQLFTAYAMSEAGGSFNPALGTIATSTTGSGEQRIIERSIGRGAIVKRYDYNDSESSSASNAGLSPLDILKMSVPLAAGLLAPFLCEHKYDSNDSGCPAVFVV